MPFILGILVDTLNKFKFSYLGSLTAFLVTMTILYLTKSEGLLCLICAMLLIMFMFSLGIGMNLLLHSSGILKRKQNIKFILTPLLFWILIARLENILIISKMSTNEIKSEIILPYSNLLVFDAIKSVDTLIAKKGILMHLGLPIPSKCVLDKEELGALRTCYFEGGKIIERITEITRGKILKMDVINYELTGRKWLGFKEAIYLFDSLNINECKLTRITTYTSELQPRIYWQPIERIAIEEEQKYVFDNLINDLKRNYSN
ncbi:MAG: polyketide cyclase [Saprospiraceae bacterium]